MMVISSFQPALAPSLLPESLNEAVAKAADQRTSNRSSRPIDNGALQRFAETRVTADRIRPNEYFFSPSSTSGHFSMLCLRQLEQRQMQLIYVIKFNAVHTYNETQK
jgi:hypothetical protein